MAIEQAIFDWDNAKTGSSVISNRRDEAATHYAGRVSDYKKQKDDTVFRTNKHSSFFGGSTTSSDTTLEDVDNDLDKELANIALRLPRHAEAHYSRGLTPIQEWEGYVTYIEDDVFQVNLVNIKDKSGLPAEAAVFSMQDLPESDRNRVEIGSIARWVIGYERLPTGQRQKVSRIHLRRMPVFTPKDIDDAYNRADDLLSDIFNL